ncbi:Glycerophosphoryl diester phosphodiesterase [Alloiococcus otitis]|uniref:GP-PDE domain-containing protein n=1 Tax=Alloiococcus otitis ATCC 51267 TaxID=883081 RepID=K9EWH6_9LACT|nr:glycerophosphodiester phosphodiesterase [Alloiococcus otitis]EKU93580.1 hypothetical protein HMPREF9698_00875 [Alloiococcus otitis ATCC 51267]SUU80357.1 Glycerophosphoryl diester phosphodiesterase [Alloiococcus otitis]
MKKKSYMTLASLIGIAGIYLAINQWPVQKQKSAFTKKAEGMKKGQLPLVIAHRAGAGLAPEGSQEAFDQSIDLGVNFFELDVHLTKDGQLLVIHDPVVDRVTNGSGRVNDMTLAQVQDLDAGYHFQDEAGHFPYRGQGVSLLSLDQVFARYPDQLFVIEFKASNRKDLHQQGLEELWRLIQAYQMQDQVTVGSFDQALLDDFARISDGQVALGAGISAVASFVVKSQFGLTGLTKSSASSFQLPLARYGFDLTRKSLRKMAHKRGLHFYYWTVNDEREMKRLIDLGVDGIMTDYPDRLLALLDDLEKDKC